MGRGRRSSRVARRSSVSWSAAIEGVADRCRVCATGLSVFSERRDALGAVQMRLARTLARDSGVKPS
jgi:hypothetical protein